MADRIMLLKDGKIAGIGSRDEIASELFSNGGFFGCSKTNEES